MSKTLLFLPFVIVTIAQPQNDTLALSQAEFSTPPDSVFVVDEILIVGNEKTKGYVLLREMTLKQGEYITADAIENDKKRIYNLGLFTRVEMGYIPTAPSRATLLILVSERWYIYPFPVAGIKDRDWKKFYFGAGIAHQNFRGRNEKLYALFTLGYDPTIMLSYRNPLIDEENEYFLGTSFAWRVIRNRSLQVVGTGNNFDERHFSIGLDFGKRYGLHHTAWVSPAYEIVRVSEYRPGRTVSSDGKDAFPLLSIGYVFDTRDLQEYAMAGSFVRTMITKYGFPGDAVDFVRYAVDVRRFVPITSRLTLAGRAFADIAAGGEIPPYSRRFLGYSERIRGHFSDVREGEHLLGTSVELRFMLVQPRYLVFDFVPIPEFAVWKFGIAGAIFGDAGTVWFRHEPLALNRFIRGYGAGIHFILPYGFVLRTDYARNADRKGEFIIDLSAAF